MKPFHSILLNEWNWWNWFHFFSSPAAHSIQQIENLSFVEGRARQPINSSFLHQPPKQRNNISFFGLLNEKKRLNLIEGNASIPSIVLICLHSHYAKTNNWFHSNYFSKTSSGAEYNFHDYVVPEWIWYLDFMVKYIFCNNLVPM